MSELRGFRSTAADSDPLSTRYQPPREQAIKLTAILGEGWRYDVVQATSAFVKLRVFAPHIDAWWQFTQLVALPVADMYMPDRWDDLIRAIAVNVPKKCVRQGPDPYDDSGFWDGMRSSAALADGMPAWTGAGVLDHNSEPGDAPTKQTSSFVSQRIVSEPGAGITITALELTPEAQRRLCTNGVSIPGMTSEDSFERIRQAYEAGIAKRERDRVLAAFGDWLSTRDYDLVDVDEVKRFVATLANP